MKRRLIWGILSVAVLVGASGLGVVKNNQALGEQAVMGEQSIAEHDGKVDSNETAELKEAKEDVQTADNASAEKENWNQLDENFMTILEGCNRSFICDYLIDESFLVWFYTEYGEDRVALIADAVNSGCTDADYWYQVTGCSIHVLWADYCKDTGYQLDIEENIIWQETQSTEQTVLDFTGDINFSEGWSTMLHMDSQVNGIYECFSSDLLTEMNQADIMMINNEFTYSTRGTALEGKAYTFRADPSRVQLLDVLGVDIVNLANNHVCDYGDEAIYDTFDTLSQSGIPYVGAGRNLEEAEKPVYFIANGKKIAIVAATQIERSMNYTKEATQDTPGVLKTLDSEKFCAEIREAEQNADYVIAFVHWGTEGTNYYEGDQTALAEQFVEAGADAIIGGHTHCLQGMEYIGDVPVIYSLGNFWFNGNKLDTGMAQVIIRKDGTLGFRFLPCIQAGTTVSLVTDPAEKQRIIDFMQSISADGIQIDGDGNVTNIQ